MTPTAAALIDVMAPRADQQPGGLKAARVDNRDLKRSSRRNSGEDRYASPPSAEEAMGATDLSADIKKKPGAADAQVKAKGRTRPTALFIDKSGSMEHVELGMHWLDDRDLREGAHACVRHDGVSHRNAAATIWRLGKGPRESRPAAERRGVPRLHDAEEAVRLSRSSSSRTKGRTPRRCSSTRSRSTARK
jgi:hypothetical protein